MYGTNKELNFRSRKAYTSWVHEKYRIDSTRLFYIAKNSYSNFIHLVVESKLDYFYGIFENDSIVLRKSNYLEKNESCIRRVLGEINTISKNNSNKVLQLKDTTFKSLTFYNIVSDIQLKMQNDNRKKIILIFSYKAGTITRNDFEQIQTAVEQIQGYDLLIISLDNLYDLT